jgi:hypothetical protein
MKTVARGDYLEEELLSILSKAAMEAFGMAYCQRYAHAIL